MADDHVHPFRHVVTGYHGDDPTTRCPLWTNGQFWGTRWSDLGEMVSIPPLSFLGIWPNLFDPK